MNGLVLSREYFLKTAQPRLLRDFPALYPRLAAGLAGNGSECFGFDDELSRDHDWGIDFFIWTTEADRPFIGELSEWKSELYKNTPPEFMRKRSEYGASVGVMTCGDFYKGLIGVTQKPEDLRRWLQAPEENFALTVNGEVFYDGAGEFSQIRTGLLEYYPEDVRLKKISAHCMALAQTGQYNHLRTTNRRDHVTLCTVLSRFTDAAIALVFCLNRVYKPYYKWAFRAMTGLPVLGSDIGTMLTVLARHLGLDDYSTELRCGLIEDICAMLTAELKAQKLTTSNDTFMTAHAEEVRSLIRSDTLRSLPAQYVI